MKRAMMCVVVLCFTLMITGTCFAEHWEYLYTTDFYNTYSKTTFVNEIYFDTD